MAILDVEGLEVIYGRVRATRGVSFTIEEGEVVALVGANGAGKSSTLKAIMGMAPIGAGDVRFRGRSMVGRPPFDIVRQGIGYAPEGRRVFPAVSVLENLVAGAHVLERRRMHARLTQMFTYFPVLRERSRQLAGSLSGGEQQMLAIGRALMSCPRLLLLDEPSLGLAPVIVRSIGRLMREIQSAEGLSVLLAEQNSNWALTLASRGVVLEVGVMRSTGSSLELRGNDYVRRAYLGR